MTIEQATIVLQQHMADARTEAAYQRVIGAEAMRESKSDCVAPLDWQWDAWVAHQTAAKIDADADAYAVVLARVEAGR
jgi:hypothetical protein